MAASSSGAGSAKPKFVPQNLNDIYGRRKSSAAAKSKQPVDALSNGPAAAAARGKFAGGGGGGGGGERGMLVLSVPVKKERPPLVLPPSPAAASPVIPSKEFQISASNPSQDKGKLPAAADAAIATSAPESASNLDLDTQKSTCSDLNPATASNSRQDKHKPTIAAAADNISLRPQRIFPRKLVNADEAAHDTKDLGLVKNESKREHSPVVDALVPAKRPEPFRPPHLRTTSSSSAAAAAAPRGSHLRGHDPENKYFLRPNQEQKQEPRDGYSPVATTTHDAEFGRPISATFHADNNRSLGFGHARQGRDRERERERERDYHGRSSQVAGLANTRFESQANTDYSVSQFQSQFHRATDHLFRGSGSHRNQYSRNPNTHRSSIEGYQRNLSSITLDSRRSSSGIHVESFPIPTDIQGHRGQLKVIDGTDSERRSPMQQIQSRSGHQEKLFTANDDPFYKGNPGDSNHELSGMLGSSLSLKEIHKPEFPTRVQKDIEWKSPEALYGHKTKDGKHMEARRSSSIIGGYSHDSNIYSQDSHLSKPNSSFEHRHATEDRQPSSKLIRSYNHYFHQQDHVSNFRKTNHQFNRGMEHKTNSYESRSSSSSWRKEGNHSRSSESQRPSSQNDDNAFK